jgi:hypothetical protein
MAEINKYTLGLDKDCHTISIKKKKKYFACIKNSESPNLISVDNSSNDPIKNSKTN